MYDLPARKSTRLVNYDYSHAGVYFITICVKGKVPLLWHNPGSSAERPAMDIRILSEIHYSVGNIPLSFIGLAVEQGIRNISDIYRNVVIGKYVIMPNHVHLIIEIDGAKDGGCSIHEESLMNGRPMGAPTTENDRARLPMISNIVNQFKGYVTRQVGFSIWQKSFFDRVIRNKEEYDKICKYIENNPPVLEEALLELNGLPNKE